MTKDEYRALTKIENEDEAHNLLVRTNWLFVAVFIAMILANIANYVLHSEVGGVLAIGYFILIVYLVYHSAQVIKRTHPVTKAWAGWALVFAPISWIWFYPELVKPLKIIIGIMDPPTAVDLPKQMSEEERNHLAKRVRRSTWRTIGITTLIAFGALVALFFVIYLGGVYFAESS